MTYNSALAHRYIDGGAEYGWVSFSGIIFTTDATAQSALPVASGWTSGGGWPGPTYAMAEGRGDMSFMTPYVVTVTQDMGGVHLGLEILESTESTESSESSGEIW